MVAVQNEATLFTLFAFPSIHDPTSTHSCAYHSWKEIMNDHTVSASFKYLVMLLHALKKKKKNPRLFSHSFVLLEASTILLPHKMLSC